MGGGVGTTQEPFLAKLVQNKGRRSVYFEFMGDRSTGDFDNKADGKVILKKHADRGMITGQEYDAAIALLPEGELTFSSQSSPSHGMPAW